MSLNATAKYDCEMRMRMRMQMRMQQTVQNSLHFELGGKNKAASLLIACNRLEEVPAELGTKLSTLKCGHTYTLTRPHTARLNECTKRKTKSKYITILLAIKLLNSGLLMQKFHNIQRSIGMCKHF